MKTRFPDATARAPLPRETVKADPVSTGSLPEIVGLKRGRAAALALSTDALQNGNLRSSVAFSSEVGTGSREENAS
jgi:hypothetical protein